MSLIITSSSQDTFDDVTKGEGLQNPANYQNNFRSPIIIQPNSEIAVASVKCQREGFALSEDRVYAIYWGTSPGSGFDTDDERRDVPAVSDWYSTQLIPDPPATDDNGDAMTSQEAMGCSPNRPMLITMPKGTYSQEEFANMLQERTDRVLRETYEHISNVKVEIQVTDNDGQVDDDLTAGVFKGWIWEFKQDDANASTTDNPEMDWTPYIDADTLKVDSTDFEQFAGTQTQDYDEFFYTDKFSYTKTGSNSTITKQDAGAGAETWTTKGTHCEAIGTGLPLGLAGGTATFDIGACDGGFRVGLTRNLITKYRNQAGHQFRKVDCPVGFDDDQGTAYQVGDCQTDLFYDFGVQWDVGEPLEIFHVNSEETWGADGRGGRRTKPSKIEGEVAVTNASMLAGYYDHIQFYVQGEQVSLKIQETATGNWVQLIKTGDEGVNGKKFKPVGMTNNMLYPKIYIEDDGDSIILEDWWHSANNGSTTEGEVHSYWTYRYLGQSFYDPVRLAKQRGFDSRGENKANLLAHEIDTSKIFQTKSGDAVTHSSVGLNASNGVAYEYTIKTKPANYYGLAWMTNIGAKILGSTKILGLQAGNYRESNGPYPCQGKDQGEFNEVTFWSQMAPDIEALGSLFVRISSLPHNSYNGCTESMSKILWTIPRFDTSGKSSGALYFEPHERLYVDLGYNEVKLVLNNLNIQIVDVDETEAKDLVGNTIVILHIREKGKEEKGRLVYLNK